MFNIYFQEFGLSQFCFPGQCGPSAPQPAAPSGGDGQYPTHSVQEPAQLQQQGVQTTPKSSLQLLYFASVWWGVCLSLQQTPAYSRHTLHQDRRLDRGGRPLHRHHSLGERHSYHTITHWPQVPLTPWHTCPAIQENNSNSWISQKID